MWMITPTGMFSIVADPENENTVKVRARVRADLEALCELEPMRKYADEIVDTPNRDYACRIFAERGDWAEAAFLLSLGIDYFNHKDAVKERQGAERADVYMGVWAHLLKLQTGGLYADWESDYAPSDYWEPSMIDEASEPLGIDELPEGYQPEVS